MIVVSDFVNKLSLTELSSSSKLELNIKAAELNRPGMQFCGFYEFFAYERPQVIGKVEMAYLEEMTSAQRKNMYDQYFSYEMPCIICCRGMNPPNDFLVAAKEHDIPVYRSEDLTTKFSYNCIAYLNRCLAPRVTRHGVLVDVYGVGILITGESGVGKSETALELVKRGHQLVADDVVDICRVSDTRLIGECPEMVRHLMEIRGIGIIDIRAMYGIGSVSVSKSIDLVMHLEQWVEGKEYERLGLSQDYISILGVKVPRQLTPVRPGRNLAIIIEVAARDYSLKLLGYNAAHELDRRLNKMLSEGTTEIEP